MSHRPTRVAARIAACAALAGASMGALAQQPVDPVLLFEHEGLDALLVSDKDEGLRHALSLIPDRISELPDEIPGMDHEIAALINTALATIARPARVSVSYNPNTAAYGAFGYGLVLSIEAESEQHAGELHGLVSGLVAQSRMPYEIEDSSRFDGMSEIAHPAARLAYGPREDGDGWRYEIVVGSVTDPSAGFEQFAPDPDGMDVVYRARVDLAGLTPGLQFAHAMAGPQNPDVANLVMEKLEQAGLQGEDAVNIDLHAGYGATEAVMIARASNASKFWDFFQLRREPIPSDHYSIIPADVFMVTGAQLDLRFFEAVMDHAADFGAPIGEFEDEFRRATGLDLRRDILRMFGGTGVFYTSDSTGGGSLLSSVVIMQLTDRNAFLGTHHHLLEMANGAASQIPVAGRYMKIEPWSANGMEFYSLRFHGLPVPLELTYGIVGQWFVMSPTPQGAMAAGLQIAGRGGEPLTSNPRFAAGVPTGKSLYAFSFIDPDKTFRNGYPLVSLIGSAIANGVRSPNHTRDAGMVVPTYGALYQDAKPISSYSWWEGDALVSEYRSDRSMLVNMATQFGSSGSGLGGSFFPLLQALEQHSSADLPPMRHAFTPHLELVRSLVTIPETE